MHAEILFQKTKGDNGSILLFALLITLILLFHLGSVYEFSERIAREIALQSRLDVCAVALTTQRMHFYENITDTNKYLKTTVYGVYALRGASLIPIPGLQILGKIGEQALLNANKTLWMVQES